MKSKIHRFTLLLICALGLIPAIACARAGGGEGYNGGGGGGGGHGGGGGGGGAGGWMLVQFIFFCISHPVIGVPLLIIIAIVVIYYQLQGPNQIPPTRGSSEMRPQGVSNGEAVGVIRGHDPAFDPDAFCSRAGAGFFKLQSAWCDQNLQQVRPFISDGIHERFSLQFAEQKTEGYRDRMDNIAINRIAIVQADTDEIYDQISLQIWAHAVDFKVSLQDGRPLEGMPGNTPFSEIWSFLRRRGATTFTGKPGLLEGNCPNCGAPISINESANCTNCNALLHSGQYDWVLSEITQATEWQPGTRGRVPGLAELRQRDPDLNAQALEDRASVIFWRKASADRLGKIDPMFKVTSPAYGQTYTARLKGPPGEPRNYFGKCAVGAVDVIGFSQREVDQALVGVRWSGVQMQAAPGGLVRQTGPNLPHHTLLVLMRKSDAKTDAAKGISSAHCPNCGAPESGGTSGACEFCGTALNDGSNGWVLDNILSFSDPQAQSLVANMRT